LTIGAPTFPEAGWFEALREAVADDAELSVTGRWCTLNVALVVGEETILLRLREGKVAEAVPAPDIGVSWSVTLRGSPEDWRAFLRPEPPPFHHDLLAMNTRVPSFSIEGDRKAFVRHLRVLRRVFEIAQKLDAHA
jgi:hypothetical protein